jgi:hypothetical protein
MTNLVLTKSSGPKCHAIAFTAPILPVFVCITQILVGGGGEGAVGGGGKAAKQSECPFTAKVQPFIQRLSISQTSEHFLPEVRNVAFCILILKSVKILKSAKF